MSPARKPTASQSDLFALALGELDQAISKPSIIGFVPGKYAEQDRFFRSQKRARFISGGNRGGKTDSIVIDSVWMASNTHPYFKRPEKWGNGPLQLRFVVVDIAKGVEQIMLPKFKRWMPKSMMIDGSWDKSWDAKNLILTFANGSSIDFVTHGMELLKLGGVPRHVIYYDEEPPQHIFNESSMRLADYNGYWTIAATPTQGMTWTFDLLWEPAFHKDHEFIDCFEMDMSKNPYMDVTEDELGFLTIGMDKEERAIRESGSFVARSGLVFPVFAATPEKFIVPEFVVPDGWKIYSSVDHGWNNPTAWLWHAVSEEGQIVTFAEHYASNMTVHEHAEVVKAREIGFGRVPTIRTGDPAMKQTSGITGTSVLQAYALEGLYLAVENVPHDVMTGVEKMQQYFRLLSDGLPTWRISSNCPNLIRELKRLRWATYTSEKTAYTSNKREEIHKKDDHAFDSARYFATLMPDLRPTAESVLTRDQKVATTIDYATMMARMREDGTVHFVEDETDYYPDFGDPSEYEDQPWAML